MRRRIRVTKNELKNIIKECVLLEGDFSDKWDKTYLDHERRNHVDPEIRDLVIDLHTLGGFYEDVWDALQDKNGSQQFNCSQRELETAKDLLSPIYSLMMNRSDIDDDEQKMTRDEIMDNCGDNLEKLAQMRCLGTISRTAKRLLNKLESSSMGENRIRRLVRRVVNEMRYR
jgi:hypothetical protein